MAEPEIVGPVMINATKVLKSDGTRIGRISKDITLPRTVRLVEAVAVLVGGFAGLLFAALFGAGLQSMAFIAAFGALVGYVLTTYSPLKGESLGTWVTLQITSARSSRRIDGKLVTLSVGVSPAGRLALGKVKLRRGAIRVAPGAVDERGVLITRAKVWTADERE